MTKKNIKIKILTLELKA